MRRDRCFSRRRLPVLAVMVAAVLAAGTGSARAAAPAGGPRLSAAIGVVEVLSAGQLAWTPATVGQPLAPGDALRTGPASKAEVAHAAGVIRLFERTLLRLPADAVGAGSPALRRVELLSGQSLFSVARDRFGTLVARVSLSAGSLFEVVTPRVVAGVKGTEFAVAESGVRSAVAVYSGLVETTDAATGSRSVMLGAGQMASYGEGGFGAVSGFDARRGLDSWSDAETQSAPGLEAKADAALEGARAAELGGASAGPGGAAAGRGAAAGGPGGGGNAGGSDAGNGAGHGAGGEGAAAAGTAGNSADRGGANGSSRR